ncbi:MAG: LPS export ABC transporter permease LptG [Rhodospirillales bacterium]|nr:LPS export ABC transporter permease LptG [Rhodospirillales bacterium]
MRLSPTLSLYIGRQFASWFVGVFLALIAIVFLFDLVELLRRASGKADATFAIVIRMSLFKLPNLAQDMVPFVVLAAAMLTFWRLTRNQELTVVRAAGVSVWQFLLPVVAIAVFFGGLKIAVLNPVAAVLYGKFEQIESRYLRGRSSLLAVSPTGLWLREVDGGTNSVVHAQRISSQDLELQDVMILSFEGSQDRFIGRVDASTARLMPGYWELRDAWITAPERPARFEKEFNLPTEMTVERIQEGFASPETISFWELPAFIRMLENAGFSALRHRLYWHSLVAGPLLLFAMVLIAASFSLRPSRQGGALTMVVGGITAGFLLFFLSNIIAALGQSASLPVLLAAWAPTAVSTLLGVATLLYLEDG